MKPIYYILSQYHSEIPNMFTNHINRENADITLREEMANIKVLLVPNCPRLYAFPNVGQFRRKSGTLAGRLKGLNYLN